MNAQLQPACPDHQRYRETAIRIGRQLIDEAVWSGDCCTWTGDDMEQVEGKWKVVHQTVDPYQYSGLSGIACFLLELWQITQHEPCRETTIACLKQAVRQIHTAEHISPGLYNGTTGTIITLLEAGHVLSSPELSEAGLQLFDLTRNRLDSELPESYDIIDGLAGILLGLLHLEDRYRLDTLALSTAMAERIIAAATRSNNGCAWPVPGENESLTGFAHGASGIAHALMTYHSRTRHRPARETALGAIRFENSLYEPEQNNWASCASLHSDHTGQPVKHHLNWCHGAAGSAGSRPCAPPRPDGRIPRNPLPP